MSKKRVLIVDDEQHILDLLKLFVEQNNCEADTSNTAESGLAQARTGQYDMVLLDINLPDGNGLDLLKKIKDITPQTPIIMITAVGHEAMIEQCRRLGSRDYIVKPFNENNVRSTVEKYLG